MDRFTEEFEQGIEKELDGDIKKVYEDIKEKSFGEKVIMLLILILKQVIRIEKRMKKD